MDGGGAVPPLDLLIKERMELKQDIINGGDKNICKTQRRQQTLKEWQQKWTTTTKGRSTKAYLL